MYFNTGTTHNIPIISFEYAEQNLNSGSSAKQATKVEMADILVTKFVDNNSPKLFLECAKGTHLTNVFIRMYEGEIQEPYPILEIELRDVWVSSYALIGETGSDSAKESFTLGYSWIVYSFEDSGGPIAQGPGWDLLKNHEI